MHPLQSAKKIAAYKAVDEYVKVRKHVLIFFIITVFFIQFTELLMQKNELFYRMTVLLELGADQRLFLRLRGSVR